MRRFMLCFDPERVPPEDEPDMSEIVWDAFGEVIPASDDSMPSSEQVQSWTDEELAEAYDWAMNEAEERGSGGPRPAFTLPWDEDDEDDEDLMCETTLYVEIVIKHGPCADASDVLDRVLDNGDLQDAIVGYADAAGERIEIDSAIEFIPPAQMFASEDLRDLARTLIRDRRFPGREGSVQNLAWGVLKLDTTPQPDIVARIERGKAEISADIAAKRVPVSIARFADLHDHVDANTYAGLCDADLDPETSTDLLNEVQNALDAWICAGYHKFAATAPADRDTGRAMEDV